MVNGEIYNHLDLRAACSSYRFQRKVDSEVVLALHAQRLQLARRQRPIMLRGFAVLTGCTLSRFGMLLRVT